MVLRDLLRRESVLVPLDAADRGRAIAALVEVLALPGSGPEDRAAVRAAVLARETAGSTGIGHGVAIPHARAPQVPATCMAAARTAAPVDFAAADGQRASLLFLLAIPAAEPRSYLPVLAALSRLAGDQKLLRRLNKAADRDEFYDLISDFPL